MWLGRFIDEPCTAPAFGADMFDDYAELARERETTDRKMLDWAGKVTAPWLTEMLRYTSKVDGRTRELSGALAAMQLFNHGTHHRGQLTTLLRQAGHDPGYQYPVAAWSRADHRIVFIGLPLGARMR
jgi:uncharacterized damage-inducible protein DinB